MAKHSMSQFIRDQSSTQKPVLKVDLTGKVVVVTGANTGLGFEACKHIATMNPRRLIMGCRNRQKGEEAISKLSAETGYKNAEFWQLDLASFASVKSFADKYEKEGERLDILIENAGVTGPKTYETTSDGWATLLQVNAIAPALHALLLVPIMLRTAKEHSVTTRIVNVSSDLHYSATLAKDKEIKKGNGNMLKEMSSQAYFKRTDYMTKYNDTKFLNVLFTRALQRHIGPSPPVVVSAVNPGFCISELRRDISGIQAAFSCLMEKALALTMEEGSRQLVYAALAQDDKMPGGYTSFNEVVEPSDDALNVQLETRFWNDLISVVSRLDGRIPQIVEEHLKL
ncbi:hypothetical protein VNI00_002902 [Paramarasmius palmivorus]|uniref:NAD(P)-binding protein n=1 Tax=Paramarasmius palmivorus TaxID=297713 RepID=A0AAW0DWI2_9AGAR